MTVKLHQPGLRQARSLVRDGKVVRDERDAWSEDAPSADEENAFIEEHGWAEYRTPPAYQEAVMSTYSFNNHALRRFHETLKDAVDPNGILAAGRYGIWPKHLRKA